MQRIVRRTVLVAVAAAALVVGSSPASAKHRRGHSEGSSAVDQYVEQIPTSSGSRASGLRGRKGRLNPKVQQTLQRQGGKDAQLLEEIATSEAYGAPVATGEARGKRGSGSNTRSGRTRLALGEKEAAAVGRAEPPGTVSALKSVVTDGSDRRLLALLVLMGVITVAALGTAAYRQRASRLPARR